MKRLRLRSGGKKIRRYLRRMSKKHGGLGDSVNQGRMAKGRTGEMGGSSRGAGGCQASSNFSLPFQCSTVANSGARHSNLAPTRGSHIRVSPFWSHPNVLEFTLKGDTGSKRSGGVRQHRRRRQEARQRSLGRELK